jgi:hypothetical protein
MGISDSVKKIRTTHGFFFGDTECQKNLLEKYSKNWSGSDDNTSKKR